MIGVLCWDIPIVVPRTNDCITLFMGAQERYFREFSESGGTFWLNSVWLEQSTCLFDTDTIRRYKWQEYAKKYGEDNANYLIEMKSSWISNYSTLGYIYSAVYDSPANLERAKEEADSKGRKLRELNDDLRLLRMMVDGTWNDQKFLILSPGRTDHCGLYRTEAEGCSGSDVV